MIKPKLIEDANTPEVAGLSSWELERVIEEAVARLLESDRLSPKTRANLVHALENCVKTGRQPFFSVEEEKIATGNTLYKGGAFYKVHYIAEGQTPETDAVIGLRIKKTGEEKDFRVGRKVQKALETLKSAGELGGIAISPLLYIDHVRMLTVEPFIEHQRASHVFENIEEYETTEASQKNGNDEDKQRELLEKIVRDTLIMSRELTEHSEDRDDEGDYLLKDSYGMAEAARNRLKGNLAVPTITPLEQFL